MVFRIFNMKSKIKEQKYNQMWNKDFEKDENIIIFLKTRKKG